MRPSLEEQETIVRFEPLSDKATVYTSDSVMMKRLAKYRARDGTEWTLVAEEYSDGDTVSQTYECPKKLINLKAKARTMTEEQRQAAAERLRKARKEQS